MTYGICDPREPDASCVDPIVIQVYPPCATPELAEGLSVETLRVRGVDAHVLIDGELWIPTHDFTAYISTHFPEDGGDYGARRERALEVAQDLRAGNPAAGDLAPGTPLRPRTPQTCE